ncbi:MAG: asparagine synthase (glutamine-hydrolyzing) [Pseudomonadota bacterium]
MCGIAGVYDPRQSPEALTISIKAMTDAIEHRGPDDEGFWIDSNAKLALGQRRLAIIDLSQAGHQPMICPNKRYILNFNGEIYNHLELREQLTLQGNAPSWRGHSDTETLLACFASWGVKRTLQSVTGMFAIALWDSKDSILTLCRDRGGEKPLYYGWQSGCFLFGSELKALKASKLIAPEINRDVIALYLRHNCVPAPYSIYVDVSKLRAGHYVQIPLKGNEPQTNVKSEPYWQLADVVLEGQKAPFEGSYDEAVTSLENCLKTAISKQMLSDVPLGAFLSGGIDSSVIVTLMQSISDKPIKTFTIGSSVEDYNEAQYAELIANYLGTQHTELYLDYDDALESVMKMPEIYCEPFSDSSQIPTYLISKLTREHVTVALSGDAGDELFGGYNRYLAGLRSWNRLKWIPRPLRSVLCGGLTVLSPQQIDQLNQLMPKRNRLRTIGDKMHKLAKVLDSADDYEFYRGLVSHWDVPDKVVLAASEPSSLLTRRDVVPEVDSFQEWMMVMDFLTYLPDDILAKVDRASMASSLEARVPFLDPEVISFAWTLPINMKIRNGSGKQILRDILYRHLPRELIDRPKMGFAIPLDKWLRGPLRDWAEYLLDKRKLDEQAYFDPVPTRKMWSQHLNGSHNLQHQLWDVLMFQAWLEVESN